MTPFALMVASIRCATHRSATVTSTLPQSFTALRLPASSVYQTVALNTDDGFLPNVVQSRTMTITIWLPSKGALGLKVTAAPLLSTTRVVSKHVGLHEEHEVVPGLTLSAMSIGLPELSGV